MSVRKRLERKDEPDVDVDALIEKGAKVKEDRMAEIRKWIIINVRITETILKEVDKCKSERVGISRTAWILEAIQEKLKRTERMDEQGC